MLSTIPGISRSQTKNQIRDTLLALADAANHFLSRSRANNMADKYKKGVYDPETCDELRYLLTYQDPVGEQAVRNVMRCHAAVVTHKGLIRCNNQAVDNTAWDVENPVCEHHHKTLTP